MSETDDNYYKRLSDGISASVEDGEIVINWVAVVEILDTEGDRVAWVVANNEASPWGILGLLDFAQTKTRGKIDMLTWAQHQILSDEDDEDDDE